MNLHSTAAAVLVVLIAACSGSDSPAESTAPQPSPAGILPTSGVDGVIRTTSGDQTGNRVIAGTLDLGAEPLRIEVGAEPRWIVGGPIDEDTAVYVVVSDDGSVTAISVAAGRSAKAVLDSQDPATPPVVVFGNGGYRLIAAPTEASGLTAPAVMGPSVVSVTVTGVVSVVGDGVSTSIDVAGLGDSRLAVDDRGLVAILSDPTAEYPHGVVGDRVESATATIFDPVSGEVVGVASAPSGTVFETVAPMWADVDGDDDAELVLTASDARDGARLVVYDERGVLMAMSAPIGRGQRWRNQLGVAMLGGAPTVVDVRTPHIGGIVEWFQLEGDRLERVAAIGEYSSHRIGRRNLDQGLIVDGDGDGALDVVVPAQNQEALAALSLDDGEPTEVRSVPLGSRLSTNLSAFTSADGHASLALGLEDGSVLIWP